MTFLPTKYHPKVLIISTLGWYFVGRKVISPVLWLGEILLAIYNYYSGLCRVDRCKWQNFGEYMLYARTVNPLYRSYLSLYGHRYSGCTLCPATANVRGKLRQFLLKKKTEHTQKKTQMILRREIEWIITSPPDKIVTHPRYENAEEL